MWRLALTGAPGRGAAQAATAIANTTTLTWIMRTPTMEFPHPVLDAHASADKEQGGHIMVGGLACAHFLTGPIRIDRRPPGSIAFALPRTLARGSVLSTQGTTNRITIPDIRARKGQVPLVCLTAYSTPMARLLDPHVDMMLVGDSVGMVLYGMKNTLGVSLDMMIAHGAAVGRGAKRSCVILDMPFASYQESPESAFRAAARVMALTGCAGIKLEGGEEMADTISFLTRRGIPVLGHVGLQPQSVHAAGGYRAHGRDPVEAERIMNDAHAVANSGAFALVIESTVESLARQITASLAIPTIGIGASPACDGQVLVSEDILGLFTDFRPRFVKRYAELAEPAEDAIKRFADDVRAHRFPGPEHCFGGED